MDSSSDRRLSGRYQLQLGSDLRLGLSISPSSPSSSSSSSSSTSCDQDYKRPASTKLGSWPPIKRVLRCALAENGRRAGLYVKVYLEGVPIGRKVDLLAQEGYGGLAAELSRMFGTHILLGRRSINGAEKVSNHDHHLLTYEDREGDWMMAGDVPWRMFLGSVKRLKIVRADSCL